MDTFKHEPIIEESNADHMVDPFSSSHHMKTTEPHKPLKYHTYNPNGITVTDHEKRINQLETTTQSMAETIEEQRKIIKTLSGIIQVHGDTIQMLYNSMLSMCKLPLTLK